MMHVSYARYNTVYQYTGFSPETYALLDTEIYLILSAAAGRDAPRMEKPPQYKEKDRTANLGIRKKH
jgi:hypothetical protein